MDISKFNKDLGTKIARARSSEKNNDYKNAIRFWIEVSDMTLKVSKIPGMNLSYRTMLIGKTEQIIQHIKNLKSKISVHEVEDLTMLESFPRVGATENFEQSDTPSFEDDSITSDSTPDVGMNIIDEVHFKNMPDGFKEIEPPKDFKILTPHDPDHVKETLNKDVDMSVFQSSEKEPSPESSIPIQSNIELDDVSPTGKAICFACGTEISPNSSECKSCGTKLK